MVDLILKNGKMIDVSAQKICQRDILIKDGIIVGIDGSGDQDAGQVIDVSGKYVAPGFIDFHIHIESSMMSPIAFGREVIKHGTTAVFVDPHEIANVCGRKGIALFLDQADRMPLDMYVGIPSCVPATDMETAGAAITLSDIKELLPGKRIYGLAEMMNFPGIIHGFGDAREKVDLVYDYGKIVDGHCPGLRGEELKTYISNGHDDISVRIMSDHETGQVEEAIEKSNLGMHVGLRYGSASQDMDRILPGLVKKNINLDRFMLCSDDLDPIELYQKGHVNRIIKRARDIIMENSTHTLESATTMAISLATLTPGRYISRFFKLQNLPEIGEISNGKKANLVVFDSLETLEMDMVMVDGKIMVRNGTYVGEQTGYDYSPFSGQVNIGNKLKSNDFKLKVKAKNSKINVKVIDIIPGNIVTRSTQIAFEVRKNELLADSVKDIAKIAVIERHHATGNKTIGFVRGLGIKRGAIASTVAHDSHNVIVAGVEDEKMARAVNYLAEKGGGMVAVADAVYYFPLKICGLMSDSPLEVIVREYRHIKNQVKKMGSPLENTFMTLAFLALPVIPELKITDRGLVDVATFRFVNLF
ncbi:MAG: adenine deaminase [Candidatus Aminicenantes bacterium]|nr:adenine deaminase [Candidatus Aminicenantes bacterium]